MIKDLLSEIIKTDDVNIIIVECKSVTIKNITNEGSALTEAIAIKVKRSPRFELIGCSIFNCTMGVFIKDSNNITLKNNKIKLLLDPTVERLCSEFGCSQPYVGIKSENNSVDNFEGNDISLQGNPSLDYIGIVHESDRNCKSRYTYHLMEDNDISVPPGKCLAWRDGTCEKYYA